MHAARVAGRPSGRAAGRLRTAVVVLVTAGVIGLAAFLIGGGLSSSSDGVTQVDLGSAVTAGAPKIGTVPPSFSGVTYDGKAVDFSTYLQSGRPVC